VTIKKKCFNVVHKNHQWNVGGGVGSGSTTSRATIKKKVLTFFKKITNAGLICGARPQVVFHLIFKNCKPVHVETPTLQGMVGDGVGSGYASTLYNSNFNCFNSDQELQN